MGIPQETFRRRRDSGVLQPRQETHECCPERARRAGVPVLALAGSLGESLGDYRAAGVSGVSSVVPRPMSLDEAMRRGAELVEAAAARVVEIFAAGREAGPRNA